MLNKPGSHVPRRTQSIPRQRRFHLQDKLKEAKTSEDVVGIAKEHGHEFTADKITELSEEELESVSGGLLVSRDIRC